MMTLQTPLTRLLGIDTPILSGPMAGASGGELAAAVTLGGGFGFMAAGYDSPEKFQSELEKARTLLQTPKDQILPIGVGFLAWQLEHDLSKAQQLLDITLNNKVKAVWFAFGQDLGHWVQYIHDHDEHAGTESAVKVFIQTSSVTQALDAMKEWKVDVIVVQGNEAGGHGDGSSLSLFTLLPLMAAALSSVENPILVAAGGLATGAQIASILVLGATGVVLGTRFLLSPESLYTDVQKKALINADSSASTRTMAFDTVRNTLSWPKGIDGRALRNNTVDEFAKGEDTEILRKRFVEGTRAGDPSRILVWAGSGVGLMNEVKPAKMIVRELHETCTSILQSVTTQLISN